MNKRLFNRQRGVVLWLTLVALFSMILIAVGLIRSTESGLKWSSISASQLSLTNASDLALEDARSWLVNKSGGVDPYGCGGLTQSCTAAGYSANYTPKTPNQTWDDYYETNKTSFKVLPNNAINQKVEIWIQRMCSVVGAATSENCAMQVFGSNSNLNFSVGGTNLSNAQPVVNYAIIARISGNRNEAVLVQTTVQSSP